MILKRQMRGRREGGQRDPLLIKGEDAERIESEGKSVVVVAQKGKLV